MTEFEVPRNNTVAMVVSVLAGNARLRRVGGTRWRAIRTLFLAPFVPYVAVVGYEAVVTVPGRLLRTARAVATPRHQRLAVEAPLEVDPPGSPARPLTAHSRRGTMVPAQVSRPLPMMVQRSSSV